MEKTYRLGIVPHYQDFKFISETFSEDKSVLIIDLMTTNIEATTNQFLKCDTIVSSSLHGIIVAHAYGIPAVWQKFSEAVFGDDIKYQDYFESVQLQPYQSKVIEEKMTLETLQQVLNATESLPKQKVIDDLCDGLMAVCPFKKEIKHE
ncbi:polysaccharide pyruvyl transferase family protein [Lacinutrix neustonica]|uniref:Polysaccharide pyruvyl transferase family protein n=1 Tax=Lacinutrix neustonica TaxID=2980107 RepID=A0A9E8MY96_9FLAO|nr:polysaccharide pyruvyl transferase family protein [Lacinutrix neustonica]WAC03922.1 polysaccharide pyruvyl transferase family protein [Lacinutrix neustonica]